MNTMYNGLKNECKCVIYIFNFKLFYEVVLISTIIFRGQVNLQRYI